jgi:hypothetical protein
MAVEIQDRQVGDTRTAIAGICTRPDGSVVDLTSLTPKFAMYDSQGNAKVTETEDNVSITDATAGKIQYEPQAADVDTEGTFYAYFIVEAATGEQDTFPVETGHFKIEIKGTS